LLHRRIGQVRTKNRQAAINALQTIFGVLKNTIFGRSFGSLVMKKKDKEFFKKLLTDWLEELLNQAGDTVSGMTVPKENFPDPTDRAALEADRNFMLRIRDREHKLIKKIKEALGRIENDTYGVCESCGGDISLKRLKARPVTTQCIDCKSKEEALEKALGL
jgi:DnaK suppressor protein